MRELEAHARAAVDAARNDPANASNHLLPLADHMMEAGDDAGAAAVRVHTASRDSGIDPDVTEQTLVRHRAGYDQHEAGPGLFLFTRRREYRRDSSPRGAQPVPVDPRIPVAILHHNPTGGTSHGLVTALQPNESLNGLLPFLRPEAARALTTVLAYDAMREPLQLARVNIDAKGNEPGVNMWTGEPTAEAKAKKPPIRALAVPEHHWADGIAHQGVHPGTNAAAPTADAAWYERTAVHRVLGEDATHKDVADHIAAIKKIEETDAGRKLLGPALDAYRKAAKVLPELVPPSGATPLLRGSANGPRGNVVDRLQTLLGPIVRTVNKVLVQAGKARPLGGPATPAGQMGADEPVEHEWSRVDGVPYAPAEEAPEEYQPTIRPAADDAPIKVLTDRQAKKVKSGIVAENAAEASKPGWEYPPAGRVVSSVPGETGPTGHRWNHIRELLSKGHDRPAILEHLKRTFFLTHANAAATFRRFLRAEDARRGMEAEGGGPVRLARPDPHGDIQIRDLSGTSHEHVRGGFGGGRETTTRVKIDPLIAGTSLAYHLRKIAQDFGAPYGADPVERYNEYSPVKSRRRDLDELTIASLAEHALSGKAPPGFNGDPYKALGERLRRAGHPLARAYNWARMGETLKRDQWVGEQMKDVVEKYRRAGETDSTLWDRVHRAMRDQTDWGRTMWKELGGKVKGSLGARTYILTGRGTGDGAKAGNPAQVLLDSIHRISDRHLDREYLAAVQSEKRGSPSKKEGDPEYWRDVMNETRAYPGGSPFEAATRHLKLRRKGWGWVATQVRAGKTLAEALASA